MARVASFVVSGGADWERRLVADALPVVLSVLASSVPSLELVDAVLCVRYSGRLVRVVLPASQGAVDGSLPPGLHAEGSASDAAS